jgi:hypothetical protein
LDVVKQTSGLMDVIRILGTADDTVIKGCDEDKTMFVEAKLKQPVPEFEGDFGLTNMGLLSGLLNFANYRSDDATFSVKKRMHNDKLTVEQFEFRNAKTGNDSDFRMMNPDLIPDQATIPNIPWDVTFVASKAKVSEFQQLAGLYSEVDKTFGIRTVDSNLQFFIGDANSSSHRVSMVFQESVTGAMKGDILWNTSQFLNFMKLAGNYPATVKITSRGVLAVIVETAYGDYSYFMRANR